jgi:hypothetical protein
VSEVALADDQRDAFPGHLHGVGVTELVWREPAPHSCRRGGAPQLGACCGRRPVASARSAVEDAEQWTDRERAPDVKPRLELFPSLCIHADLAAAVALAVPIRSEPRR